MADRARSIRRRKMLRFVALLAAAFVAIRATGPGLVVIRDDSFAPSVARGDVVLVRRVRERPIRGAIVLAPVELRADTPVRRAVQRIRRNGPDPRVLRAVIAGPGDEVTWTESVVTVRTEGEPSRIYRPASVFDVKDGQTRRRLGSNEVFLLSPGAGRIDSRMTGPVDQGGVQYRIQAILWPAARRGPVQSYRFR